MPTFSLDARIPADVRASVPHGAYVSSFVNEQGDTALLVYLRGETGTLYHEADGWRPIPVSMRQPYGDADGVLATYGGAGVEKGLTLDPAEATWLRACAMANLYRVERALV
jgi:hypothetical protein